MKKDDSASNIPPTDLATQLTTPLTEGLGTVIGPYKLLEQIGEGGFGVVWAAEQREPVKRRVALKIIKVGMDTKQVVARFEAERQALAMMDHPNIAKVLGGGSTDSGRPFFCMELVKGIPITEYCDENKLATQDRLDLFIKVCFAIQHAHQKGIIHRDIKPSNILVSVHDGAPVPKVIDFGIAKTTQQELTEKTIYTQLQQFIGTPAYMSPEQAVMSGLDIDTRSDIYSLGVLLYELLTGKTPFDAKELMQSGLDEMRKIIRERDPVRPSTRLSQITAESASPSPAVPRPSSVATDLDWIVMKALEKDRTRRYDTANGLAADIKRHLNDEPVVARPPSAAYRFQKAWRRNKLAYSAGATVALALVTGIVVSLWQARVAEHARVAEAKARATAQDNLQLVEESERKLADALALAKTERERAESGEYVATMNLIQQDWEHSNLARMRHSLEKSGSHPDLGFEWRFWHQQLHQSVRTFRGHTDRVASASVSPDGKRMATGSSDNTIKIWDIRSGRELFGLEGHTGWVRAVDFSPDGKRLVSAANDLTARVWEIETRKEVLVLQGHSGPLFSAAFSGDGQWIATGSADYTAKVWDSTTGELKQSLDHGDQIWGVAISNDGRKVLTGGGGGPRLFIAERDAVKTPQAAKLWDWQTDSEPSVLRGYSDKIWAVGLSPDGRWAIAGGMDKTARVWDTSSGELVATLEGHTSSVFSVAFARDNSRILTGSVDSTAILWDWDGNQARRRKALKGHTSTLWDARFLPDNQWVVTASSDGTARLWDSAQGDSINLYQSSGVWALSFAPNEGDWVVTGGSDGISRIWDLDTQEVLLGFEDHAPSAIYSIAVSPDGQWLVTGDSAGNAIVWDRASANQRLSTPLRHQAAINCVAISPDAQWIATASSDHTATLWRAATGEKVRSIGTHNGRVRSIAFSPDGRSLATGNENQPVRLWDLATGASLNDFSGPNNAHGLAFSPDQSFLVAGRWAQSPAEVWNLSPPRNG